jgi:hypothetical protein
MISEVLNPWKRRGPILKHNIVSLRGAVGDVAIFLKDCFASLAMTPKHERWF